MVKLKCKKSVERGIKLVEDYNNSITRDETQKQFLLQVSNLNILKIKFLLIPIISDSQEL